MQKEIKFTLSETYRNSIVNLYHLCKVEHYKSCCQSNKKDSKKIQNQSYEHPKYSSRQITLNVNKKTATDECTTYNFFKNFFISIAFILVTKIPTAKLTFQSYLKTSSNYNFFLTEEVEYTISVFHSYEAVEPNSVSIRMLKYV